MASLGEIILAKRKAKGLSQEKLAELSMVNLRTIQRVEKNESEPHGKTLKLIGDVLELDISELSEKKKKNMLSIGITVILLLGLNFIMMFLLGYFLIDSKANLNSRIAGLIISFLLPYFIVSLTKKMNDIERLLKYGSGFILYIILAFIMIPWQSALTFITFPMLIAIATLFRGNNLIKFLSKS